MKQPKSIFLSRVALAVAGLCWSALGSAQTWNLNANGLWGVGTNWLPASVPNGVGSSASLLGIITAPRTVTLDQPITLGSLTLDGAFAYTIGGANPLTFDVSSGNAALNVTGSAAHTISSAMVLNDTLAISQGSSGTLTLGGGLSGAGGLVKNGTGSVTLTAASSYLGPTQIGAGTLFYNIGSAIPAASVVTVGDGVGAAASAVLNINSSMSGAQALNVTIAADGVVTQNNNRLVRLSAVSGTGEVRLNSVVGNGFELSGSGPDSTFGGAVTGGIAVSSADPNAGSRLTKSGASTQTFSGSNTYIARTFINGGSLRAASNGALGAVSAGFTNATFVYGTGSLELSNNITLAERIYLNGAGNGGAGALRSFSGNNTITSNVTLGWAGGAVTASAVSIGADAGSTLTINGNLDGAQALSKVGDGTLVLSGSNAWGTSTTVNGGTLRLGSAASMPDALALTVNGGTLDLNSFSKSVTNLSGTGGAIQLGAATLTVNQTSAATFAGSIAGTGALVKNGAATLTLTGTNSYGGGTIVAEGTLLGNSSSLQGAIVNGSTVVFDQGSSGTYAGAMSGSGSLVKNGVGTLALSGANTYSGGTTVNGGTLQGNTTSLQGSIVNNATLTFDQVVAGTYAGAISGSGSLVKLGPGALTLTGSNPLTGTTAVNGGSLVVLGSLASSVSLTSGTTLSGTGAVGGLNAAVGSTVAPGNPNGTLTVDGTYAHAAGATFRVLADGTGASTRLYVNGIATLAGGAVDVQALDGNYANSTRYTILSATGGVGGAFSSVTSSLAFLTPTLTYDPNNVFLDLSRNAVDFAGVALTPNQRAVANALDHAASVATGDMATVIGAVSALTAPQARSAYESIGGLLHTLLPKIGVSDATQFNRATASRLRMRAEGTAGTGLAWSGIQIAQAGSTSAAPSRSDAPSTLTSVGNLPARASESRNVWLSGYGLDGDLEGDASSGDYDYRIGGVIIGADVALDDHWIFGASASYSDWRVTNDGRGDRADVKAYRIGGYGRFTDGPIKVDGVLAYGNVRYETDRRVVFGTINRAAQADYDGDQFTAYLIGRYRFQHGDYGIEPFAALQWVRESQDGFSETGADSISLAVANRVLNSTRGTLGVRIDRAFEAADGKGLVEVRAGYSHEFSRAPSFSATLVGDPTRADIGIVAESWDRDSWIAGAGLSFSPNQRLTLYLDFNGDFQSSGTVASIVAGIRGSW